MSKYSAMLLGAAAGIIGLGAPALSQTAGPFTLEQAQAGRQAYADNCAAC